MLPPDEAPTLPFWQENQTLRLGQPHWYPQLPLPLHFQNSSDPVEA